MNALSVDVYRHYIPQMRYPSVICYGTEEIFNFLVNINTSFEICLTYLG